MWTAAACAVVLREYDTKIDKTAPATHYACPGAILQPGLLGLYRGKYNAPLCLESGRAARLAAAVIGNLLGGFEGLDGLDEHGGNLEEVPAMP